MAFKLRQVRVEKQTSIKRNFVRQPLNVISLRKQAAFVQVQQIPRKILQNLVPVP